MFLLLQTYRRNSKTAQRCSKTNLKNQSMCGFCCFFWWPCYIWRHKICQCCLLLFVQSKLPLPSERSQGLSREAEKNSITQRTEMFSFFMVPKNHIYFETKNYFRLDQTNTSLEPNSPSNSRTQLDRPIFEGQLFKARPELQSKQELLGLSPSLNEARQLCHHQTAILGEFFGISSDRPFIPGTPKGFLNEW